MTVKARPMVAAQVLYERSCLALDTTIEGGGDLKGTGMMGQETVKVKTYDNNADSHARRLPD